MWFVCCGSTCYSYLKLFGASLGFISLCLILIFKTGLNKIKPSENLNHNLALHIFQDKHWMLLDKKI